MARPRVPRTGESIIEEIFADSESEFELSAGESDNDSNMDFDVHSMHGDDSGSEGGDDDPGGQDENDNDMSDDDEPDLPDNLPQQNFRWRKLGPNAQVNPPFVPAWNTQPGVKVPLNPGGPIDYFHAFFPRGILALMAEETNRYAMQYFDDPSLDDELPKHSRLRGWKDTDEDEIKVFVALEIAMGFCGKNRIQDYWDSYWLTRISGFKSVMSRDRYLLLRTFMHFNDNTLQPAKGQPNYDPLYKVRPVINLVKDTYLNVYQPHQHISADEIMKKFKGRLSFKQYIPNKPNKWGIKIWSLCDSLTGFNLRWQVYTGKDDAARQEMALGSKVVLSLVHGLDGRGHQLYMDNFFSSPDLYSALKDKGIGACGTVRANRKGLPKNISKAQLPLKQGERPAFFSCDQLTFTTWQDTARVNCLTTIHGNGVVNKEIRSKKEQTGKRTVIKPALVEDYNRYMGGGRQV